MQSKEFARLEFIKNMPVNLKRRFQREQRIANGGVGKNRRRNQRKRRRQRLQRQPNFYDAELKALIQKTEETLKEIFENEPLLSDLPYDITAQELRGEVALAKGRATVIYIKRDGLSTLKIVLPQKEPTIANLKRAIEIKTRVQLKRDLRCTESNNFNSQVRSSCRRRRRRHRRRLLSCEPESIDDDTTYLQIGKQQQHDKQQKKVLDRKNERRVQIENTGNTKSLLTVVESTPLTICKASSAGELVCSVKHNGHLHRPSVSWRFLWRAYALYDIKARKPIDDRGWRGRLKLSDLSIENGQTLKFCSRVMYFGRTRQ